jgi:hypothetical protein
LSTRRTLSRRPPRCAPVSLLVLLTALITAGGCRQAPTGPAPKQISLSVLGEAVIFAAINAAPSDPFRVVAVEAGTQIPVADLEIQWQVVQGSVSLTRATATTDANGVASTSTAPAPAGVYRVRASAPNMTGAAPVMELRVVPTPTIESVDPAEAAPGDEVVVNGTNFGVGIGETAVYFDGIRGTVISATSTRLRVVVPLCLPPRQVNVMAGLGGVLSEARTLSTSSVPAATLALQPGEVRTLSEPADLACVRLPGEPYGALYLVVPHNAAAETAPPMPYELRALSHNPPVAAVLLATPSRPVPYAEGWEAALRLRERDLVGADAGVAEGQLVLPIRAQAIPEPGTRRDFNVLNLKHTFDKVTATARLVTQRAVLWVDVEAESAFAAGDLEFFGKLFDDPIYPTNVSVFGEPSDVDGNKRIFILFTPRVNALTPRNQSSYITGFFYGCDLLARNRCTGSNEAEIFYSMVPDTAGKWGSVRPRGTVRAAVPPILAHEFQHMIHFAQRGGSSDVLWLSEGLAHTAEELVGDALQSSDPALARTFQTANLSRAQRYLADPAGTSLLEQGGSGSIEMRGGAWLLLKHMRAHYGGNDLLRRLTANPQSGVANLTQVTAQPWHRLATDFNVAVWADGAPEMAGVPLAPRYRFAGFNLRAALQEVAGGYPLRPTTTGWRDFAVAGTIATGGSDYLLMSTITTVVPLNFVYSGARGAPFNPGSGARLSILRVK